MDDRPKGRLTRLQQRVIDLEIPVERLRDAMIEQAAQQDQFRRQALRELAEHKRRQICPACRGMGKLRFAQTGEVVTCLRCGGAG